MPENIFKEKQNLFEKLIKVFKEENSKINLSSFNDDHSILIKHIMDSLNIFQFQYWQNLYKNEDLVEIADIGTGGGFPGLALAIALPNAHFTLIESIAKKAQAVLTIIKDLDLSNVEIINRRVEDLDFKYDVTVSRAVAEFNTIYKWSKDITSPNGKIYLFKSRKEEIQGFNDKIEYSIDQDDRVIYEFT